MDEAIERDSMFAMAYAGRTGCLQNLGRDQARQISDRIRAYEMRDRMTWRRPKVGTTKPWRRGGSRMVSAKTRSLP